VSIPEIKEIYLKEAFDSAQIHRMRGINYQFSDAAEKLSRYQAKTSQVYVRIFHQCTNTKISVKKILDILKGNKKKKKYIYIYIYTTSPPFLC
jgi:hypothetical protein